MKGQFLLGSNYTFLTTLAYDGVLLEAVYKPAKGEMPLWDFPPASLAGREVAAFLLSDALGWNLVPATVIRRQAAFGKGSVQLYIPHNTDLNYFTFSPEIRERLRPAALFDLVINNADRKGSHILLDSQGSIWLIDHGLSFHSDPKLRTVVWDFAGQSIPANLLEDIARLRQALLEQQAPYSSLKQHLRDAEIRAVARRIQAILNEPVFPEPDPHQRAFPWPLV